MLITTRTLGVAVGAAVVVAAYAFAAQTYQVDSLHSSVGFTVPVAGGLSNLQGRFNKFTATIDLDENNPTKSRVAANIDVFSLDTGVEARDKHTLGRDGFDAAHFPTISFVSKKISKRGEAFDCLGDLTLRGVKKEVAIHFSPTGTRNMNQHKLLGFQGNFTIDRRDFGMNWQMSHDTDWIGNRVDVQLHVLARPTR